MGYLWVCISTVVLYVFLRTGLSLMKMGWKKLSKDPQPVIKSLCSPLHLFIVAAAAWLSLQITLPPSNLEHISSATSFALIVALAWLGVRAVTLGLCTFYLGKIKGIRVPRVLPRMVNSALYAGAFLAYLHLTYAFGIGDLILTTAIILIVLCIAFQSLLSHLFSGISINLEDAFRLGDLIQIGEFHGVVVDSNWRRLHLLTAAGDHVTVPYGKLLELPVTNFSRPDDVHRAKLNVLINGSIPPNQVQKLLTEATLATEGVLQEPPPAVYQDGVQGECLSYTVAFSIRDYRHHERIADGIRSLAWYRLRREGLRFPFGAVSEAPSFLQASGHDEQYTRTAGLIQNLELFAPLSSEEIATLARRAHLGLYGRGERLFNQGDAGDSLYIVASGSVGILLHHASYNGTGAAQQVATVTTGGVFGEISLLAGEPRSASAVVAEESELICITKAAFQDILLGNPRIAADLSAIMAQRLSTDAQRTAGEGDSDSRLHHQGTLFAKITAFFQLEFLALHR
jgi:small-conductance mechanosensitive channel/CRP-like cAMP-binding protein